MHTEIRHSTPIEFIAQHPRWIVACLWLGWWIILNVFQVVAFARLEPARPDYAYAWSASYTQEAPPASNPVKLHVRWDSGFYVSIALYGYDGISAAFFPLYPLAMRVVNTLILQPILPNLNAIDRMELAGFLVSSMASLIAALGLFELLRGLFGEADARRGVFYFLVYPPAVFLLQVYSEPLFLALTTWCLTFLINRNWWRAGLLACIATLDRGIGSLLVLPILINWGLDWYHARRPPWRTLVILILPGIVLSLYLFWLHVNHLSITTGQGYFGRWLLPNHPFELFGGELGFVTNNPQATVHIRSHLKIRGRKNPVG